MAYSAVEAIRARATQVRRSKPELARELDRVARALAAELGREDTTELEIRSCPKCGAILAVRRVGRNRRAQDGPGRRKSLPPTPPTRGAGARKRPRQGGDRRGGPPPTGRR
jgi:hypothetical protein